MAAAKEKVEKIELRGVTLVGWEEGRAGSHSLHVGKRIINFVDGKADLPADIADELEKDGYVE